MMAPKHLHELLKEEQEPFHLKSCIAERRLRTATTLQVKKRKPINIAETSTSKRSFCRKHACLLSFLDSPDVRRSPLIELPSPAKSPCKTQNGGVLLHVPARTAALLLEAAMRIQKQQRQQSSSRSKSQLKNVGFGLFDSIFKMLKDRNKNKKRGITNIKTVDAATKEEENFVVGEARRSRSAYEMGLSCSCNNSRLSSAGWSESNEEKSLELVSSISCSRFEEDESVVGVLAFCEKRFCASPFLSSSGHRTPDLSSPAACPSRYNNEEKDEYGASGLSEIEPEDEEKEQCSPISVLDPLFDEDDDNANGGGDKDKDGGDYDNLECSFALVQRKQQLLDKLRRFEKLAELNPVELEKRMIEQTHEEDGEDESEDDAYHRDNESSTLLDSLVSEVFCKSSFQYPRKVPADMKRLVLDLLTAEMDDVNAAHKNREAVRSVCKKLNSWKEVQCNTIDMMFQLDYGRDLDAWRKYQEQIAEITAGIEHAVSVLLLEELAEELLN